MDKTKLKIHILLTLWANITLFFLAENQISKYQLPSIGNFRLHAVSIDQSLDITTGILVDLHSV